MENYNHIGRVFKADNFRDLFIEMKEALVDAPKVGSRVAMTKELLNPVVVLTNPRNRLCYNKERKFNLIYALVESYMLFNTTNRLEPFVFFNKRMADYSDNGETLNSAYGQYIAKEIPNVIRKLKQDNGTRQAVMNIYNSSFITKQTKDVPCTVALNFLIRDGKLNLTTYMRSNDFLWGFQYDLFVFTMLQEIVANSLGIDVGVYTHCPTSLHVYEYHWEQLEAMTRENTEYVPDVVNREDTAYSAKIKAEVMQDIVNFHMYKEEASAALYSINITNIYYNSEDLFGLIRRDINHRTNNYVQPLQKELEYIRPFVTRWYK